MRNTVKFRTNKPISTAFRPVFAPEAGASGANGHEIATITINSLSNMSRFEANITVSASNRHMFEANKPLFKANKPLFDSNKHAIALDWIMSGIHMPFVKTDISISVSNR